MFHIWEIGAENMFLRIQSVYIRPICWNKTSHRCLNWPKTSSINQAVLVGSSKRQRHFCFFHFLIKSCSLRLPAFHFLDVFLLRHTWLKWKARHQAQLKHDNHPFISVVCGGAQKHRRHCQDQSRENKQQKTQNECFTVEVSLFKALVYLKIHVLCHIVFKCSLNTAIL